MNRTETQKRVEARAATGSAREWQRVLPSYEWECGCTISKKPLKRSWWQRLLGRIKKT